MRSLRPLLSSRVHLHPNINTTCALTALRGTCSKSTIRSLSFLLRTSSSSLPATTPTYSPHPSIPKAFTKKFHQTPSNMVNAINNREDFQNAISNKVAIIDCYATWCGPCKVISPHFERLEAQVKDVEFFKMDVDTLADLAAELGIRAMPTFLFFENGVKVNEVVGANPKGLEAHVLAYIQKSGAEGETASAPVTSQ